MNNSQSLSQEFKRDASALIEQLIDDASRYFAVRLVCPSLSFRRSGSNAGTAHLCQNRINLNPIYALENEKAYLTDVIPHEVAHIVAHQLFGKVKPHGREWQAIMGEVFQRKPNTRHNLKTSETKDNSVVYFCQCGDVKLTIRRHRKVQRGLQHYKCRKCGQVLAEKT